MMKVNNKSFSASLLYTYSIFVNYCNVKLYTVVGLQPLSTHSSPTSAGMCPKYLFITDSSLAF
jgi:hypothetical protein